MSTVEVVLQAAPAVGTRNGTHQVAAGAGAPRQCLQQEEQVAPGLMPHVVLEAERVSNLMLPGHEGKGIADQDGDTALQDQLERTRALARETGLPEMRHAVVRLESQLAAASAARDDESRAQEGRHQVAQQLARLLPSIGPDLYTHAAVRRQVMAAIERIEIESGQVVSVTLAAG